MAFFRETGQNAVHRPATCSAVGAVATAYACQVQVFVGIGYFAAVFVIVGAGQVVGQIFGFREMVNDDAGIAVIREKLVVADRSQFVVHAVGVNAQLYGRYGYPSEFIRARAGAEQGRGGGHQADEQAVSDNRMEGRTVHDSPKLDKN